MIQEQTNAEHATAMNLKLIWGPTKCVIIEHNVVYRENAVILFAYRPIGASENYTACKSNQTENEEKRIAEEMCANATKNDKAECKATAVSSSNQYQFIYIYTPMAMATIAILFVTFAKIDRKDSISSFYIFG